MKRKVIYGKKGREYNAVAGEIERYYYEWLAFAGVTEREFFEKINRGSHQITKTEAEDGEIQINVFADRERVIVPLVYQPSVGNSKKEFFVNAALVLFCAAKRSGNKNFEKCVSEFFKNYITS